MNTFSIQESIKYGWEKFRDHKSIWAASLAMFILVILSSGKGMGHGGFGIISLIANIMLLIAEIGYNKLLLRIADGEQFEWGKGLEVVFNTHKVFWKYLGVKILFGIMVVIGFILLIIPGIWVLSVGLFGSLIVIDTGLSPIVALKESREITKGNRLKLVGFILVVALINIIGALALGLGLLVSLPVSMLAMVHVYRKLLAAKASPTMGGAGPSIVTPPSSTTPNLS